MAAELLAAIARMDVAVFRWLRAYHAPPLDVFMAALSEVARAGLLWALIAGLVGCFKWDRWPAVFRALLAIGLSALITDHVAKPFADRARPFESYADTRVYGPRPTSRSLPSGHASNAVAAAYALSRGVPAAAPIFWTLAFLVGFSRVYLGVHYPLDVIVGALIGLCSAVMATGETVGWKRNVERKT